MEDNSALNIFPRTHVKPYDGMSVTADVWAQSHDEHRQARSAHDLVFHGAGIITGLEVQANDPPDQYVFISPGVAVDPVGNLIVVSEPVAYDFGSTTDGLLYLVIGHGEREAGGVDKDTKLIHDEFVVAGRSSLPKRPVVELARVFVSGEKAIKNAENPAHPSAGELDLRFRAQVGPQPRKQVYVGLVSFGRASEDVAAGWRHLAAESTRISPYQLIVDANVSPSANLSQYDLVYLNSKNAFGTDAATVKALQAYLAQGKTLFTEALASAAEPSFAALFEKLDCKLAALSADTPLLESPFLFATPPSGASGSNIQTGKQVIYSTAAYSLAWAGKLPFEARSRSDIRTAHEWGINLIRYCLAASG